MTNKFKDTITLAYNQIGLFNLIAGNLENVTLESIDNQLGFIFEELEETIEVVEWTSASQDSCDDLDYDPDVEVLDGACDLFVTVSGLLQKLEAAGFDVAEAMNRVNMNNLSKFPNSQDELFKIQPENTHIKLNTNFDVVVFKDIETGKIKKPLNFKPVDLTGTYPNFLKGGV